MNYRLVLVYISTCFYLVSNGKERADSILSYPASKVPSKTAGPIAVMFLVARNPLGPRQRVETNVRIDPASRKLGFFQSHTHVLESLVKDGRHLFSCRDVHLIVAREPLSACSLCLLSLPALSLVSASKEGMGGAPPILIPIPIPKPPFSFPT